MSFDLLVIWIGAGQAAAAETAEDKFQFAVDAFNANVGVLAFEAEGLGEVAELHFAGVLAVDGSDALDIFEFDILAAAFDFDVAFGVEDADGVAAAEVDADVAADVVHADARVVAADFHGAGDVFDIEIAVLAAASMDATLRYRDFEFRFRLPDIPGAFQVRSDMIWSPDL